MYTTIRHSHVNGNRTPRKKWCVESVETRDALHALSGPCVLMWCLVLRDGIAYSFSTVLWVRWAHSIHYYHTHTSHAHTHLGRHKNSIEWFKVSAPHKMLFYVLISFIFSSAVYFFLYSPLVLCFLVQFVTIIPVPFSPLWTEWKKEKKKIMRDWIKGVAIRALTLNISI